MKKIIFIVGPTAVGKTELACGLAEQLDADIVSADSMLVYKEPRVITAKPDEELLAKVKHHFVDIISVCDEYNVFDYLVSAREKIEELLSNDKPVVVCGGSGLYVKALLDGLVDTPKKNDAFRAGLVERANNEGNDVLYDELTRVDRVTADKISRNDLKRIIRALEVYHFGGKPMSELTPEVSGLWGRYDIKFCGIERARDELYDRINKRVDCMFDEGVVDEVRDVLRLRLSLTAKKIIGIPEIGDYLAGRLSLEAARELMKKNTRNFAKRQLTWFRAEKRIKWFTDFKELTDFAFSS